MNLEQTDIENLKEIAISAGEKILEVYAQDFQVSYKDDNSPVTLADKLSNDLIVDKLHNYFPNIPIISEESEIADYETRKNWNMFWLVDPLDGTKEFLKKNGEFTVNIALMVNNIPIFGLIYVPVEKVFYIGGEGFPAVKIENGKEVCLPILSKQNNPFKISFSRSHSFDQATVLLDELDKFFPNFENVRIGSSLKFCKVAEGEIDLYPRLGPIMEWDMAAGQAIVQASGGKVYQFMDFRDIGYNKDDLYQPWFICESGNVELKDVISKIQKRIKA